MIIAGDACRNDPGASASAPARAACRVTSAAISRAVNAAPTSTSTPPNPMITAVADDDRHDAEVAAVRAAAQ